VAARRGRKISDILGRREADGRGEGEAEGAEARA
jgi:hypothetical protein